jgi:hypothetical protein
MIRLERLSRDKHSSLLQKFVNYGRKKFYNWTQGAQQKQSLTGEQNKLERFFLASSYSVYLKLMLLAYP